VLILILFDQMLNQELFQKCVFQVGGNSGRDTSESSLCQDLDRLLRGPFKADRPSYTLVIGPRVFSLILSSDNEVQRKFMALVKKATATILYRMDPMQKRELVSRERPCHWCSSWFVR
jgi:hypothetical protein